MESSSKRKGSGGHFLHIAMAGAIVGTAYSGAGIAQDEQATTLDAIEVTGSRIKRVDLEGPLPITVYSRDDIERTGDLTITDFLRNLPQNSFGSFIPESISGRGGQTYATISLRGFDVTPKFSSAVI